MPAAWSDEVIISFEKSVFILRDCVFDDASFSVYILFLIWKPQKG